MSANFIKLESLEALNRLFEQSHTEPVILFKHSSTCGISVGVYGKVSDVSANVNLVVVQTHRDISNEITNRTGIRHESPQAIVLKNGEPVYTASHYDITSSDITANLETDHRHLTPAN